MAGDVTVDISAGASDALPLPPPVPSRRRTILTAHGPTVRLIGASIALAILVVLLRHQDDTSARSAEQATVTATATTLVRTVPTTSVPATITPTPAPGAIPPQQPSQDHLDRLPLAVVGQVLAHAPADPDPTGDPGTDVLHPTAATAVYNAPGGQPFARLPPRQVFTPTWVPITERQPGWVRVLLPTRPLDGGVTPTGWIHLDDTLRLSRTGHRVDIDHVSGSVAVFAQLGRVTTNGTPPTAPPPTAGKPRTFVAIAARTTGGGWLTRIWLPLVVSSERICTSLLGATSVPGLPPISPLGHLDTQNCLITPDELRGALAEVPAGTIVLQR
ncbi:hypothetical protein [Saccharothrix stipae]